MKRSTLITTFFAALLGVTAQAQIITNYGPQTYAQISPTTNQPYGSWSGSWNGATGGGVGIGTSSTRFAAQTFFTPSSGSSTVYAYNVQLNVSNLSGPASFNVGLYNWIPGGNTTSSALGAGNYDKGTKGSLVSGSNTTFTVANNQGFNPFGNNFVTGGIVLNANALYAIVIERTDTNVGNGIGTPVVQYGLDQTGGTDYAGLTDGSVGDYVPGGLYRFSGSASISNVLGTNFTRSGADGANDMAFWISFDAASLSPVPEPAVNGAILGGLFVAGLLAWRRYGRKSVSANL
jgi:hypothetical protein